MAGAAALTFTEIGGEPVATRLAQLVRGLVRARHRQVYLELSSAGLFWGLVAACAFVLASRLGVLPAGPGIAAALPIAFGLAAGAAVASARRPDPLAVAIDADIALRLQQKLSTAWELRGAAPAVAGPLAAQALRERLPPRAERVYPLRLGNWARLAPLAAAMLLLASVVDLREQPGPAPSPTDPSVIDEGRRLEEFARRMGLVAERERLAGSREQSERLQRLGARMGSGELAREQALARLRALTADLDDARWVAARESADAALVPDRELPDVQARLREMLRRLLEARPGSGESDLTPAEAAALQRLGTPRESLATALERLAEGDASRIEELLERALERLDRSGRARRDESQLGEARERVRRSRERLGESAATGRSSDDSPGSSTAGDALGAESRQGLDGDLGETGEGSSGGSGWSERELAARAAGGLSLELDPDAVDVLIRAESQIRPGDSLVSSSRVLPRAKAPVAETVLLDPRYEAELEAVLSKESYPLHMKELVRRYFLALGRGVEPEDGERDTGR